MNETLREWAVKNPPQEQVTFVRDYISSLLARDFEQYRGLVRVIGTHTSKSITCPVYFIHLEDGVKVWMRYNFYNWNITVESEKPIIDCDFLGVVNDLNHQYCFCEGMEDHKAGTYAADKSRFTFCVWDHYEAYVFFRVLKQHLKIETVNTKGRMRNEVL